jgi:hypothetical protein
MELDYKKLLLQGSCCFLLAHPPLTADEDNLITMLGRSRAPKATVYNSQQESYSPEMPEVEKKPYVFLTGEFLCLQSSVDQLGYAQKQEPFATELLAATAIKSKEETLHFEWNYGFRAGLGYHTPLDEWDLYLNYMWFQGRAHGHSSASGSDGFMTEWSPSYNSNNWSAGGLLVPDLTGPITKVSSHWKMQIDSVDLLLMRHFKLTQTLRFTPIIGATTSWIDQDFDVKLFGPEGILAVETLFKDTFDNDFWGIGIKAGFDTQWEFVNHFSVFLSPAISALYGFFEINQREKAIYPSITPYPAVLHPMHFKENFHTIVPILDLNLGLRYCLPFSNGRYAFAVQVGWEEHVYFNQNRLRSYLNLRMMDQPRSGNVTLQGVNLQVRFDF